MQQDTTTLAAEQAEQVETWKAERLAQLESYTVADLIEEAKGAGITKGIHDSRKAQLVEAIIAKNEHQFVTALRQANADADAATRGFTSEYAEHRYNTARKNLQEVADSNPAQEMADAILEHGNVLYHLEGAAKWAEAAAMKELASHVLHQADWLANPVVTTYDGETEMRGEPITNPVERLAMAKQEVLAKPLMENRWRGGSTSSFSNAVDDARRSAADYLLNRYQFGA